MSRNRRTAGVTLLELVVAVSILGVVSSLLYGTFSRTLATRDYATERAATYSVARAAMDWLERDLQGSFVIGSFPAAVRYFFSSGKADRAAEELDPPLLDVTTASALGTSLLVAARGLPAHAPDQTDQAHVIYRLEAEEEDEDRIDAWQPEPGLALVRYDFRPALQDDLEEASRAVVARRVHSVALRFFDGSTWFESWDSQAAGIQHDSAPLLVEIRVMVLAAEGEEPLEFVSAVILPLGGRNAG